MVRRYDATEYRKPELTPAGFLKADAVITRTGVFTYKLGDGTVRNELRLPEDVFHPDALKSFEMLPVTDDHPLVPVTAANVKQYQAGQLGSEVAQDGQFVTAPMLVTDSALIKQMQAGQKQQVSCGYDCDLDMSPGEYQGQKYDAVQRNIRGNHVAIVERGRAGPAVRVRLDATDGVPNVPVQPVPEPSGTRNAEPATMNKITIDGIEYTPDQVPAVLARRDAAHAAALKQAETALATARADAEKAAAATKADLDKATARADALKTDLDKATKARTDAEDPARVRALVAARVAIESKARKVLPAETKFDGMSEADINAAMLTKLEPELKLDGKSADYIQGRLDHALARFEAESDPMAALRRDADPLVTTKGRKDTETLRAEKQALNDERAAKYRPRFSAKDA